MGNDDNSPLVRRRKNSVVAASSDREITLGQATDQLNHALETAARALESLNFGIEEYVPMRVLNEADQSLIFHELGFAKLTGKWNLVYRQSHDFEERMLSEVPLTSAPRQVRVAAATELPVLRDRLKKVASEQLLEVTKARDIAIGFASDIAEELALADLANGGDR